MSALLALVPWYWRWIALGAAFAACFGYGWMKGVGHEERAFDIYRAKVEALGDAARAKALEQKKLQDDITMEVAIEHQDEVDRIRAYYARRLQLAASGNAVPAAPVGPEHADAPTDEPGACGGGPARDIAFERACALDAELVMKWQQFARKNNFPIGEPR